MFNKKKWIFTGSSGTEYLFGIHAKTRPLPESQGIYILAYTHPKGHLSGYTSHVLAVETTDNLRLSLQNPPHPECLKEQCWNCIFFMKIYDKNQQHEILQDLVEANTPLCGLN